MTFNTYNLPVVKLWIQLSSPNQKWQIQLDNLSWFVGKVRDTQSKRPSRDVSDYQI